MIKNITTEIFSNLTNSCGTSRASWSWRRVSTQRTSLFPTQHWIWRRKYRSAWLNWIWLSKLEVLYAAPIWNLLLVPLPLFRNQNMPCTQRIPSFSSREQFKDQNQRYRYCAPRHWEWRSPTHATTSSSPTLWPCSSSPSSSSPSSTSNSLKPSRFKVFIL